MANNINKYRKIVIIGAGYIGAVLSGVISDNGFDIEVIDIDPKIIGTYKSGSSPVYEPGLNELIKKSVKSGRLKASTDISVISKADVILMTVGTPLKKDGTADKNAIYKVVDDMKSYVRDGQLILLKSTVPPCTTEEDVAIPLREYADVDVAFCPERLAEGNAINECRNLPVIIGGVDEKSSLRASEFWEQALSIKCIVVENARTAELVKLADNAWIDLNISLSFELAKVADKINVDVLSVIDAANTLPKGDYNVNILKPSIGVGGYCLTKDPFFLHGFAKKHNSSFKTAITSREVNDQSPFYAANRLDDALQERFKHLKPNEIQISILGLAFKNNTGDCRNTPTLPAIKCLLEKGYKIKTFDRHISNQDYLLFKGVHKASSIKESLKDSHALAFFAGHEEFKKINLDLIKNNLINRAVIFDGRMFFDRSKILEFQKAGFLFRGVGR